MTACPDPDERNPARSIVVLHEGTHDRRGVVRTTDHFVAELGRDGLSAVTVSDLIALSR